MTEEEKEELLWQLMVKVQALRDLVVCLLALRARDTAEPKEALREISESLSQRFAQIPPEGASDDVKMGIEKIQAEIDAVIAAAWTALGLDQPKG